jgi:hypothetical protein
VVGRSSLVLGAWPLESVVGGFVVAGGAAGFAVHEAVFADANVELRLAEDAELIAVAVILRQFALAATKFGVAGSGGHGSNVIAGWRQAERAVGNVGTLRRAVVAFFPRGLHRGSHSAAGLRLALLYVPYNS